MKNIHLFTKLAAKLKRHWFQLLLEIFISLFIFSSINREFLPLGIDLRFIQLPIGVFLLCINLLSKQYAPNHKKSDPIGKALIIFYIYVFISNIAWLWNGQDLQLRGFVNELILLANVFIGVLVFYFNSNRIKYSLLLKNILFSCFILALSMFLVHQGLSLQQIFGSPDVAYIYRSALGVSHINIFGENFRCAGYASDPNYATMLLIIGIVCAIRIKKKSLLKITLLIIFCLAIGLSFSKTIIFSLLPCLLYTQIIRSKKIKTITKIRLNRVIIIGIFTIVLVLPHLYTVLDGIPFTLNLRLKMWHSANDIFLNSPIIGNGITSFRSGFTQVGWYVHAHSTYWQIISELGIIGLILYYNIIFKVLNNNLKTPSQYFLVLVFIIWAFTYETIALPMSVIVYYITCFNLPTNQKTKKTALFLVNSLKQGGAEKVCINLADELTKQKYNVDFLVLKRQKDDLDSPKFCIHSLNIKTGNKLTRIISIIFAVPNINDYITSRQIDCGEYNLVTSHLPVSNIITRLSIVNKQTIYVLHLSMDTYKFCAQGIYVKLVKTFFKNRKVSSVSNGLTQELIEKYGLQSSYVRTIYNPINVTMIQKSISKKKPIQSQYLLHVGRFGQQKRQDRMLEIFYKGKFYKEFQLVFCGDGPSLSQVQNKAKELNIQNQVLFLGYQNDIYTWMKHSSTLISTSDWESFSMVIAEALASGAKVVSSNCAYGPNEILTGKYTKFLVSPIDDINQYIAKINSALKSYPNDPKSILRQFNPRAIVEQYIEYYKNNPIVTDCSLRPRSKS